MKYINRMLCFFIILFLYQTAVAGNLSPIGYWKTVDEVTGKAQSIIQIWQASNNALYGKLVNIYPDPNNKNVGELCRACPGARHNQRILGMTIMTGLRQSQENPNTWRGGEILDPSTGKSYHFYITVTDSGKKLTARGYIGVPLFGRTQTWFRVASPNS